MKVSVIIPTYNRSNILKYTLSSLVNQDFPSREYEVIVIDDGSSDDTKEVVYSYKDKLNIIYYFQEDKGFRVALARNEGIKRAKGDVLIFIDTGIVVGNTFVRAHYDAHCENSYEKNTASNEKYAVIGYVYGFSYESEEYGETPKFIDFNRPNQMIQNLKQSDYYSDIREKVYFEIKDDLNSISVPWMLFYTNNVSVMKEELIKAGCFDEDFVRWGAEDVECAYRLFKNKLKFKLSREACGVNCPHERHIEGKHVRGKMNMRLFYSKHQDAVVELYTTCSTFSFINYYMNYSEYRERLGEMPLYSALLTEADLKFLSEEIPRKENIIYGCQDGFLLGVCHSVSATESDEGLILKAKKSYPDIELYRCLGLCTPFRTKTYRASLIAGAGIILTEHFLNKLVFEAIRASQKVYWLKTDNGTDVTEYEYSKIRDMGNGVSLCLIGKKI
ncbi:galactosyltransferase-like protein [Ruminiclostridium sufflavum DSM 19573]|uniref:Galactosyltransferase-like protein n=1 Tax=Ruminiclostridium sufflavum DSM 19573 TaxID=1121337 RepID=A0A318Y2A1_9FIRM|nr:glycosyltransferase [Ruminiclostridium sufflavum]PYG89569.1 galactosyltransferase-like protein [Ruminiclostridium sufflavum DSM 19573]